MHKNILIVGAGDSAVEILDYLLQNKRISTKNDNLYIFDIKFKNKKLLLNLFKKIFFFKNIQKIPYKNTFAIISHGDPFIREKYLKLLKREKIKLMSFIHPSASVSTTAKIGNGVVICPQYVIGSFANIKENVFINSGSLIGHHCVLGNNSVISPNVFLGGNSKIGSNCFLGANSNVYTMTKIGSKSKLSAGSSLSQSIGNGYLIHGNPAKGVKFKF